MDFRTGQNSKGILRAIQINTQNGQLNIQAFTKRLDLFSKLLQQTYIQRA